MLNLPIDFANGLADLGIQLTLLVGAAAAAYKFRIFDVLGHRYRSEVWCTSREVDGEGRVLFVGNYVIHNTGNRPLMISSVQVELQGMEERDGVLHSDPSQVLARRVFATDQGSSWFKVGAGERSIFPLRCHVDRFSAPVAFSCSFRWKHRGQPSEFVWLYDPGLPVTWWSEPSPIAPEVLAPSFDTEPAGDA